MHVAEDGVAGVVVADDQVQLAYDHGVELEPEPVEGWTVEKDYPLP